MKLISLNVWGGTIYNPLVNFLKSNKESTDIFCFQEMYHQAKDRIADAEWNDQGREKELYEKLCVALDTHKSFFYPHFDDFWGLAIFVKKDISILEEGDFFVHRASSREDEMRGATSKNIQYITFEIHGKRINVVNFHGLWNGQGKSDSESRIAQSENIIRFLKSLSGEIVLCGDFNLRPDTESLKMIENFGLKNLIKENGITSTRTSIYTKDEKFADYTLVTRGIKIKDFKVLPDEVSDHNPMYLEFDI